MRKIITYLIIAVFCGIILFKFYPGINRSSIDMSEDKSGWNVKVKGIKNGKDFVFDDKGNCYIAFNSKVQLVDGSGRSYILFEKDINISSLNFKDDVLYYASGNEIYSYHIKTKEHKVIFNNLPNFGDYNQSKIFIKDDIMYITVGAATNSGIVGEDNIWKKGNPFFHDFTPKNLTISANISKKQNTGAFVPYNSKNISGQIIPAHSPGNSSIIAYNIKNGSSWLYAWGLRNINGIDFNSEGRLFISVGGMEDRGARPVKGDSDYIFELKENTWYGWPDYSGGDPINSPKFKGINGERISFLLDKHPTTNPPAPIYQHKNLSTLKSLVVDKLGNLGEKDSIYFYDSKDNIIYTIAKNSVVKEKYTFKANSNIVSMKYIDKKLYILDTNNGTLAYVESMSENKIDNTKKFVYFYLIGLLGIIIISIIWKFKS